MAAGAARGPSWGVLLRYAAPAPAVSFSLVLTAAFIAKHSTDVLLIAPGVVGLIFGASRIWDAVTDPLIGYWSDRTESRFGRRRPWLLGSAIPMALFGVMVWAPPIALEGYLLVVWVTLSMFGLYASFTAFEVPHLSLGAELSESYHDRTRIFALRQALRTIGMMAALIGGTAILTRAEDPRTAAFWLFVGIGAFAVVSIFTAVPTLPERADYQGRSRQRPLQAFRDVGRNPHGRRLLFMYFIENMGSGATAVLSPYMLEYVIGAPRQIPLVFAFYTGATLLSIPLWVRLSGAVGKKRAWLFGMGISIVGYLLLFFVGEGDLALMCFVVSLTGASAASGQVLGASVQADVIDYDELETGERKEGSYYSAFTFLYKTSSGVMAMLTGFALQASGFVPNVEQTEAVNFTIRAMIGLVPFACFVVGTIIFAGFAITPEEHARIRAELEARRGDGGGTG